MSHLSAVLSIRRAAAADADVLSAIADAAYRRYVERIGRNPAPMDADYAARADAACVWIVDYRGSAVGFVVTERREGHLLIENIAVHPAEQSRGIGTLLLERAELDATEADLREVRLYTNEAMTENLSYYSHHGFTETHRSTVDGYRRVFFTKTLSPNAKT